MSLGGFAFWESVTQGGWLSLVVSFVGGLVSTVNPCVLASVFLLIGFTASYSKNPRRAAAWSLAFALGTVLTFTALGFVAAQAGTFLGLISRRWYFLLAILTAWMGLQTLHVLPGPAWSAPGAATGAKGTWLALLVGGLVTVVLSPCATPVLIAVLGMAATRGASEAALLLFVYGLGRAVPLVVIGFSGGLVQRLVKNRGLGRFSEIGQQVLGAAILCLAIYFVYLAL